MHPAKPEKNLLLFARINMLCNITLRTIVLAYVTVTGHAQRRDSAVSLLLLSVHSAFFINMLPVVPLAHTPASATQHNLLTLAPQCYAFA